MKLTGNTILITGGGSGIGLALAEAFKELGNEVLIAGRSLDKLKNAAERGFKTFTVDMMEQRSVEGLANQIIKSFPALNVVIHNAGIMQNEKLLSKNSSDVATATVATNLLGPIYLTNALLPHLVQRPAATIMTVTSGLAFMPLSMTPTYSATKAALHSWTESLRYQLKDTRIEVKELAPPYVATELMGERQASDPHAMPLQDFVQEVVSILKANPMAEEILVQKVKPLREAAYRGETGYQEIFRTLNDGFLKARQQEWDAL